MDKLKLKEKRDEYLERAKYSTDEFMKGYYKGQVDLMTELLKIKKEVKK